MKRPQGMAARLFRRIGDRVQGFPVRKQMAFGFGLNLFVLATVLVLTLVIFINARFSADKLIQKEQPLLFNVIRTSEKLTDSLHEFGLYLLSNRKLHIGHYQKFMRQAEQLLSKLKANPVFKNNAIAYNSAVAIELQIRDLKNMHKKVLTLANKPGNIPGLLYASQHALPVTRNMLGKLILIIDAEKNRARPRPQLLNELHELRYAWAHVISGLRNYLGFRGKIALKEYKTYLERFDHVIARLQKRKNLPFSFEQEHAWKDIITSRNSFTHHMKVVMRLHHSPAWRRDKWIIRNRLIPLLESLKTEVNGLTEMHVNQVRNTTRNYEELTESDTMVVFSLLVVAILSLLMLWYVLTRDVVKPMQEVVETSVETVNSMMQILPETRGLEFKSDVLNTSAIRNIRHSFTLMANALSQAVHEQQQETELLNSKIELILSVIRQAAAGDLTHRISLQGNQPIDELAQCIQSMLDSLNELVVNIKEASHDVNASALAMNMLTREQESMIKTQAARTSQVLVTVRNVSERHRELAETMMEVNKLSEDTAESAEYGNGALEHMETSIQEMRSATHMIAKKLSTMSQKAANIGTVVTTIDKVADQTNLLSLNAAIEAEKAGEYGRGFAVVANEIQRLADQTAESTWDIGQMVKEMQSAVSTGVMGMDKFSEEVLSRIEDIRAVSLQLNHIIRQAQSLTPRFETVNEGMRMQSAAASNINESLTELEESASDTMQALDTTNEKIHSLTQSAHNLRNSVAKFKVR